MRRVLATVLAAAATGALAQDPAGVASPSPAAARWYVQVDNDVFFHTDRWYSSGVRIARVSAPAADTTEWALEQDIWSPEGKKFRVGTIDRAPTAVLEGRFAWHHADANDLQTVELGLGVRGRGAAGERVTHFVHRFASAAEIAWEREVPTELSASAAATRTHAIGPFALHYGATVGNEMTFAHAGVEWRTAGAAYSPVLRMVATPPFDPKSAVPRGWGFFAGANARAVARNRLLDRPYGIDTAAPTRKDAVLRAAAGVTAQQPWGALGFALVYETREFAEQRQAQRYGSLVVHVPF